MCRNDAKRWSYPRMLLASLTFALPRFLMVWVFFAIALLVVS